MTSFDVVSLALCIMSVLTELGPKLSEEGLVVLPDDAAFTNLTSRWREWHSPEVVAVVKVITEGDVQETVSPVYLFHRR